MKIVVLGIGNPVMSDDGIGVKVVQLLSGRWQFPEDVTLLEGGTLGLDLLPSIEEAGRLLVIDAVDIGAPPGTLVRCVGEDIPLALGSKLSPHQIGLKDLLAVAFLLGGSKAETVLWGVQPRAVGLGLALSPCVEAQLEPLAGKVLGELALWGAEPIPLSR